MRPPRFGVWLMTPWIYFPLSATGGFLAGSGVHAEWVLGWAVGIAGLIIIALLAISPGHLGMNRRWPLFHGWLAGWFYFAGSIRFLADGYSAIGITGAQPIIGICILFALLAFWWGPAFWLANRLTGYFPLALSLTCLWVLAEILRSTIAPAIPPAQIAAIWSFTPVIQSTAWLGVLGLSVLTILGMCFIAQGSLAVLLGHLQPRSGVIAVAAVIVVFGGVWGGGSMRLAAPAEDFEGPIVSAATPFIEQHLRWDPQATSTYLAHLTKASMKAWHEGADIVVWPESATPYFAPELGEIEQLIPPEGKYLILGVNQPTETGRHFNSIAILDSKGEVVGRYDKRHLFPFGEYFPFAETIDELIGLSTIAVPANMLLPGAHNQPNLTVAGIRMAGVICYEGVFPIPSSNQGADIILNVSNDAWWVTEGHDDGARFTAAESRMRAIEAGLPTVRVSNGGPTFMLDSLGREIPPSPKGFWRLPSPSKEQDLS